MKKAITLILLFAIYSTSLCAQATPNASFESWTTQGFFSYEEANSWDSPNHETNVVGTFVCIKTTDKHTGTYAMKLVSKTIAGMQDAPGVVTTGILPTSNGGLITGGQAYTLRPDSIVGWYKFSPGAAGDNGLAEFRLMGAGGDNDSVAVATFKTPTSAVSSYTRFSKALSYYSLGAVVNSRWLLVSTKNGDAPVINSTIFVDDLDLIFLVRDSIAITSGANPMCAGQSITFTCFPHNGGTSPSYQWKVNGANVGTNSSNYTSTTLTTGQIVTCVLTSNLSGVTLVGNPAVSSGITLVVSTPATPTISSNGEVLTSSSASGNQWYLNGVIISGATNQTYTTNQIGSYTLVVTLNGCASAPSAAVEISSTFIAGVSISTETNPSCLGAPTTFTAIPSNGGTTPIYQWQINGVNTGTNSPLLNVNNLTNGQIITCILTSNYPNVGGNPATSNAIIMVVNATIPSTPIISVSGGGGVLTSSATTGNQWYLNDSLILNATNQTLIVTENGIYSLIVTVGGCSSLKSAAVTIINAGINNANKNSYFSIYPNPNEGDFTVSFNLILKLNYKLELRNTLGQLIFQEILPDFIGDYSKQLNIKQFGKGVYFISLSNSSSNSVKRIIVY